MEDRANGALILLVAGGAFAYVTAWLLLTPLLEGNPFVSDDLPLLSIFPPREWAISAAAFAGGSRLRPMSPRCMHPPSTAAAKVHRPQSLYLLHASFWM